MVILRGTFRHLDLENAAIEFIPVFFSIFRKCWAPTLCGKLEKLLSRFFLILETAKKSLKFCLTFGILVLSGSDRQEQVDSGTSGSQIRVQASHRYRNSASAQSGGAQAAF